MAYGFIEKDKPKAKINTNYEIGLGEDWSPENQIGLKKCLIQAYTETSRVCSPSLSQIFTTKNQRFHTGETRFIAVNHYLLLGCKTGLLKGITAIERPAQHKNGFHILELIGKSTILTAAYIPDPDSAPRDCTFRFDARTSNQELMIFEKEALELERPSISVTLVHGGRDEQFAYLRGYNDPQRPGRYIELSGNILRLPTIEPPVEEEDIKGPDSDIKDHLRDEDEGKEGQSS